MSPLLDALTEPLQYAFVRNGLLEMLLLGAASGLVGVFVVQRQLTFFAHALSHTIFPAVVLAAAFRLDLTVGAIVGAALTVLLVSGLQRRADVGHAGAVGVVFMTLFALGVVLVGLLKVRSPDVGASLVGNVLGVATGDLLLSLGLVLTLGLVLSLLYWPLVLTCFDRTSAALTLPVAILDLVLLTMVAGTAVVSLRVVGVILTVAVLVIPAATALRWTRRLPRAMLIAGVVSALAGMASLYVTYYARIAPAAVMVLVLAGVFLGSTLLGPYGVVIPRRWLAADVPAMRARDERTV